MFTLERIRKLTSADGSIEYVAAISNAYATDAERAGYKGVFDIRYKPAILDTYYNGVDGYNLPVAASAFKKRMKSQGYHSLHSWSLDGPMGG